MKFKPYPKYKASGVEWLGDVPVDWKIAPFKREIERNDGGAWGDEPDAETGTLTVVLRSTEQTADGQWIINDPAMRKLSNTELAGSLLAEGDLVVTKSSGSSLHIGKTTLVTADVAKLQCCYSNFMQRIRVRGTSIPKFVWYVMNNDISRSQFDLLSNSTTGLANLNSNMIGELKLSIPPAEEQSTIATFLDHETAKIDTLIAKQEKLIDLLKEKRQAVISHSVTKGLDPTVPMKPSGVEWLGDVPEHWTVKRIKHFGRIVGGFAFKSTDFCKEGQPVIKISNVSHMAFDWSDESFLPLDFFSRHEEFAAPNGALLFAMTRPLIAGGIKVARLNSSTKYLVNQRVGFIPGLNDIDAFFILFSAQSSSFVAQFQNNTTITNQPNISAEGIERIFLPVPPENELRNIIAFLHEEIEKIDTLIAKAQQAIALQKEHRIALISAAVTGKIDVRGEIEDRKAA